LSVLGLLAGAASPPEDKAAKKLGKVLMPIGDATEAMDTLYPFFRLAEEGYEVVVAGPEARLYHMVLHEIPPERDVPWDITREMPGYHSHHQLRRHRSGGLRQGLRVRADILRRDLGVLLHDHEGQRGGLDLAGPLL
jgi:hypothetical protein